MSILSPSRTRDCRYEDTIHLRGLLAKAQRYWGTLWDSAEVEGQQLRTTRMGPERGKVSRRNACNVLAIIDERFLGRCVHTTHRVRDYSEWRRSEWRRFMPDKREYNLAFRPDSYFEVYDVAKELVSRIKGTVRRNWIVQLIECEELRGKDGIEIPDWMLKELLTDEERLAFGSVHPSFMSGE